MRERANYPKGRSMFLWGGISGRLRRAALGIVALLLITAGFSWLQAGFAETHRFLPQLSITDLSPRKVMFAPSDDNLLLVVNETGRINVFDLRNPCAPTKITEIYAGATDAAISKGKRHDKVRVVSADADGTVRLWTLEGKPAAAPFEGHKGRVSSAAFSPDGTRIVSA